jgi:peptide/nickel transport system substrate-binding protein
MKNFYSRIRNFKLPKKHEIELAFFSFNKKEFSLFAIFGLVLLFSTLAILQTINTSFMTSVPMHGGSISEGIVGTPRFVNPILGFSDADRDVISLVYSGLMRKTPEGLIIPDLAEKYEVTPDGLEYTFTLKEGIVFHDDTPITTDDIVYTINTIKDPITKSPRKSNWDGINVVKIDDRNIKFVLNQPYATFLQNTTLGIVPVKLWAGSPVELNDLNTKPIGSGPYMIDKVTRQSAGTITEYDLTQFKKFSLGKPYIKDIVLKFYPNEEDMVLALEQKKVDQISSLTPLNAEILKEKGYNVVSSILPRVFGFFFNQNQNQIFTDKKIIEAIDKAIDKDQIVREVLGGYGVVIDNPIPPNILSYSKLNNPNTEVLTKEERLAQAASILAKDGWTKNEDGFLQKTTTDAKKKKTTSTLDFSISTGNAPELAKSAELIKQDLAELGMNVEVKTFEVGNLNQSVIRPRKYDTLLFGQIINHESDLFAFWHSSQRKDPGLNVAMYTNATVDKVLEDAFVTADEEQRVKKYTQFESEIKKDMPAVFLYSPSFIYVVSKELKGLAMDKIVSPKDRFSNIYLWYTDTDNVWKIFAE